ncbi:MAG TPA: hypothetical protein PKO06_13285 [Candidatus Ozemobacteraceae bacterium]|nr:hypothetical protein [Candidatus Ozemobacteraceae bacterium]
MRWVSAGLIILLISGLIWLWTADAYGLELHQWAKLRHTKAQLWLTDNPWMHLAIVGSCLLFLFLGISTILVLLPAMFFWPPWLGASLIMIVHLGLIMFKCRQRRLNPEQKLLPPALSERLPAIDAGIVGVSCLKLFLNLPGQAIDVLVLEKKTDSIPLEQTRLNLMVGTSLRVLVASVWAGSLISVVVNFHPFPERVLSFLLLGTAVIMWGLVWGYVPELLPGEKAVQETCKVLFNEPAATNSAVPPATQAQTAQQTNRPA